MLYLPDSIFLTDRQFRIIKPLVLLPLLLVCQLLVAQKDSIHSIPEVTVTAVSLPRLTQTTTPVQTFNSVSIAQLNVLQLSDVVKHFAGVTVKDYGGIGGLKTVSIRGLGATHTGVSYDGVPMSDAQNGQVDLGRMTLVNVEEISLANGNSADLLQSARAFSNASLLSVQTERPHFDSLQWCKGTLSLTGGSFGLIHPSLILQNKLKSRLYSSLIADFQYADGKYPYTIHNGDSIEHHRRANSDVKIFRGELNLFYFPSKHNELKTKLYAFSSQRGLPGAVILYNPYSSQGQRLQEDDYFAQASYQSQFTTTTRFSASCKAAYSYTRYIDPYFLNSTGGIDNQFRQQEYYVNAALSQHIGHGFDSSLATDLMVNHVNANLTDFSQPTRYTSFTTLKGRYTSQKINAEGALLFTDIREQTEVGASAPNRQRLSPMMSIAFNPFKNNDLQLRLFYKETYRMPTFNELYYRGIGNMALNPEVAQQFNAGISYLLKSSGKYFSVSTDVYYNKVKNKIIAIPAKDLFIWSMLNIGKVHIQGVDVALRGGYTLSKNVSLTADAGYTYQHDIDRSNSQNSSYGQLIAYAPEHSGAATVGLMTNLVNFSYNILFSGDRYDLSHSRLSGYSESGVSAWRKFEMGNTQLQAKAEVLNAFDSQYAVVRNYPMPGRSWRISLSWKW